MGDLTQDLSLQDVLEDSTKPARALAVGMEGHDVARVQAGLRRLGLATGTIDGIFGDKTATALEGFCTRVGLVYGRVVDVAIWDALTRAAADAQAAALAAHAAAHEQQARAHHAAAAAAQQAARDKRTGAVMAGDDEEQAAGSLLRAARAWLDAARVWLAAAGQMQASHQAYARHLEALEQGRSHGARAVNSLALASKDFLNGGATGHEQRLATAALTARELAAH